MNKEQDLRIVFCNTDSLENAKLIAGKLVENKIAACVSIIPNVISVYEWEGKIENREEFTLKIKTSFSKLDELQKTILLLHPDDVPEILAVDVKESLGSYSEWLKNYLA